jgi:hypothetical protein
MRMQVDGSTSNWSTGAQTKSTTARVGAAPQRRATAGRWLACLVQCLVIHGLAAGLSADVELSLSKSPSFLDVRVGDFETFIKRSPQQHRVQAEAIAKQIHDAALEKGDRVITIRLQDAHVAFSRLRTAQQLAVRRQAGRSADPAAWYEQRVAGFFAHMAKQAHNVAPNLKLSVVGLPVEAGSSGASAAIATNARYNAVIESLDAFVTTRRLILSGSTVSELSTLQTSLPEAFRLAEGRPIIFRTNNYWRSVTTSGPVAAAPTPAQSPVLPNTSSGAPSQPQLPPELQSLLASTGGVGPLAELLGDWGMPNSPYDFVSSSTFQPPPDGTVDGADLSHLLGHWSEFYPEEEQPGDGENPPAPPGDDPPGDGGTPNPPAPPPGQVGAFMTLGSQYVIGSGVNLPFSVSPQATNVGNVVFQVWSFVSHSIEAPLPDYSSPFVYAGAALANVTPGPGQVQAVVRTSTDELIAVITQDVEFVSSSTPPPPPPGDGDDNDPPPGDDDDNPPPDDGGPPPPDEEDDPTVPPADPPGTIDGSPMGVNLSDIQYYSPEWPFKNFFKTSMPWRDGSWNPNIPVALTSDGYPLLNPGQTAVSLICRDIGGAYPTGAWVLLYDGSGTVSVGGNAQVTSSNAGRLTFQVTNPTNEGIHVNINATNNANPVRNIRVMPAEFEGNYESQPFHPMFLDRMQHFSVMRFMDWMKTNNSSQQNWADRPTVNYATYGHKGAPVQIMVQLANITDASPWFCMPHLASDDYVRKFAEYVRDNLDPEIKAYVELSNECWNTMFQQQSYFQAQGLAQGLSGEPYMACLRAYSKRAVQVMDIWSEVFQGQQDRIVRVLAGHAENPWANEQIMGYNGAYQHADALAVAPYFGGWLGNSANTVNMTVDQILDAAETNIAVQRGHSQTNRNNAAALGLELIAYEGGQHLVGVGGYVGNDTLTQKFISANRHTRMGQLYLQDLNNWKEVGGGVFVTYAFCGRYSQWGSWGLIEQQNQSLATAPKFSAVVQFVQEFLAAQQSQQSQGGN